MSGIVNFGDVILESSQNFSDTNPGNFPHVMISQWNQASPYLLCHDFSNYDSSNFFDRLPVQASAIKRLI